jgi:hypothetical protein
VDASIISALAALTGAAVGGLTSGMAAWLNHPSQLRTEWILHEKSRRQTLYRDFIEEASKCYMMRSSTMKPTFLAWSVFTPS